MENSTDKVPSGLTSSSEFDQKVIAEFLRLIKERYPAVDKANFFLESKLDVSGSTIAMANQRDFLSHFCTVLTQDLTDRQKLDQVSAAEEHFRRAVIESYHRALSLKLVNVLEFYRRHIKEVVPYQKSYRELADIPDIKSIRATLREIETQQIEARATKRRNCWDEEWKGGVTLYLEAFQKAEQLGDDLEDYWSRAIQLQVKKRRAIWFYTATISLIANVVLLATLLFK